MDAPSLAELREVMDLATQHATAQPDLARLYKMSHWLAALEGIEGTKGATLRLAAEVLTTACPRVELTLAISTAHLSKETAERLTNHALSGVIAYDHGEHGWLVVVPEEVEWQGTAENIALKVHNDLFECMLKARSLGCCWLLLDSDAETIEGLDIYE